MRIASSIAIVSLLIAALCSPAAKADTRVELLGRAADNGFSYYSTGTPWSGARVGEYFHVTFNVTGPGIDITQPFDHQQQPLVQANLFNIVDGTFTARLSDVALNVPVVQTTDQTLGPITNPAALLAHYYINVDTFYLDGAFLPWVFGSCCFPDGSCVSLSGPQCSTAGGGSVWTSGALCDPNPCAQPTGACCDFSDVCTITTQANCAGPWTTGGSCTPGVTCPQVPGSCCANNGSCSITIQTNCPGPSTRWTSGGACLASTCPIGIIPGYSMSMYMSHQNPPVAWNSADFSQITGSYPGSLFNNSRSWLVSFVGTDHNSYEMFIDIQKMVVSTDTTPVGSCCPGDGHCLLTTEAICPTTSWTSGGVCTTGLCPSSGGCCLPDGSCDLRTAAACAATAFSVYQGANSVCFPSPCGATGGCCNGGSCTVVIQSACLASGGSWIGAGTTCDIVPQHAVNYSAQAGTCCTNGTCSLNSRQTECGSTSVWTQGATCSVTPCANAGACCDTSGTCIIERQNLCNTTSIPPSTFFGLGTSCAPNPCQNIGPCCNTTTGLCTLVVQGSCTFSWSSTGTCVTTCSAGECCNLESHQCRIYTQAACNAWNPGKVTWNLNTTCDTVCVYPYLPLNDAVTVSSVTTPNTYTNTLTLGDSGTVSSIEVWVNFVVGRANDIKLKVTGPNGVTRDLLTRAGSTSPCTTTPIGGGPAVGNIFLSGQYVFTDAAATDIHTAITTGVGGSGGSFKPAGCGGPTVNPVVLNTAYAGIPIAGAWTLTIIDERSGITTDLHSWGLSFNGGFPPPCTIGHCVLPLGGCITATYAQCAGTWSIGPCAPTTCSSGTPGACCFLNTCSVMCQSVCPSTGLFAGSGSTCTTTICNVRCCTSTGSCTITTAANCGGIAGTVGSTCTPNTCPLPVRCCGAAGACSMVLATSCSGTPGGTGSTCTPNTCPGLPTPPANDVCSTVAATGPDIALTNGYAAVAGTLVGATADGVTPSCGLLPAPDAWYRFTAPGTGSYLFRTCLGSSDTWDSLVSVWANCTTQVPGACDDNGCGFNNHGSLIVTLTENVDYLVRVAAYAPTSPNISTFRLDVGALGACCIQSGNTGDAVRCYTGVCTITYPDNCHGVHQGFATICSPNPCPQVNGVCCLATNQCLSTCSEKCVELGGTFGTIGSVCGTTNPCPIGACCLGDGSCFPTQAGCNGTWINGATCVPNTCPPPVGACCMPDGSCTTTQAGCTGTWQPGGGCIPNFCPQPSGACCTSAACSGPVSPTDCTNIGGLYQGNDSSCTPSPCTGACCNGLGGCSQQSAANCTLPGAFQGVGSACGPTNCGVCCRGSTCVASVFTSAACQSSIPSNAAAGFKYVANTACGGANHKAPCCYADYNQINGKTVADIFAYLTDWFGHSPYAFNGTPGTGNAPVSQIFAFLSDWFAGC